MKSHLITFLACFLIIGIETSHAQPMSFNVFEINIPGGTNISLYSINDSGYVAGVMRIGGTDYNMIYDFNEVTILPFLSGYERGGDVFLNNNRQVGGTHFSTTINESRGFLYQNGTITNVGTLGGPFVNITGINNSGAMSGIAVLGDPFQYHAVIYENGTLKDLGTIGHNFSRGLDINNLGHVTGWSNVVPGENNIYHAFLYKEGQMLDLGTLGGDISTGYAVNDSDYVVGNSDNYTGSPQISSAFIWYGSGSMESLPVIGGAITSIATDINNNNLIIGSCRVNSVSVPVIWIDGQVYRINDMIEPGFTIGEVKAINNKNQILCSYFSSGDFHWVILDPKKDGFTVNVTGDESDFDLTDEVADADPDTPGDQTTLRAAIEQANYNAGKDKIGFNIPGNTDPKILIQSPLPVLTTEIEIDGSTQIGSKVEISGLNAGQGTNGFALQTNNSVIKGLVINSFSGSGILIQNGNNNKIYGNVIGTDKNSSLEKGNGGNGISIINGANNIIGGTNNNEVNVIAGNSGSGISITGNSASGNQIISNYIGTDTLGTNNLGNAMSGIEIVDAGTNNMIGSGQEKSAFLKSAAATSQFGFGNVITKSINSIKIENTSETIIVGNLVGVFKKPSSEIHLPLGSLQEGIKIMNSKSTVISNLILGAAGGDGIRISGPQSKLNRIFDAYIGSDPNGTEGLGNMGSGIRIDSLASENNLGGCDSLITLVSNAKYALEVVNSNKNTVNGISAGVIKNLDKSAGSSGKSAANISMGNLSGGMRFLDAALNIIGDSCAQNIIAANLGPGMIFDGVLTNLNEIYANLIGTDEAGSEGLGNEGDGMIFMNGANENTIGSENPGDANISVSNKGNGFSFLNTEGNTMLGNLSGVFGHMDDVLKNLGNHYSGVFIKDSKDMTIHNGFFGGNQHGIRISGEESMFNKISKIYAGTDGFASLNLGNSQFGILLDSLANNNILGGLGKDSAVVIGGNMEAGLYLKEANKNSIYNTMSGIIQKMNEPQISAIKNMGNGVVFENSEGNKFGKPEMPNMVAANNGSGMVISGTKSLSNQILSSIFGTDSTGRSELGNLLDGILVTAGASNNFIGGANTGEGVITAGNGNSGIKISGQTTKGNEIQSAVSGIFQNLEQAYIEVGNMYGLVIENAPETTVKNSIFAANTKDGGVITGIYAISNKIINSYFGTDSLLRPDLGNLRGLSILNGANLNTIGGEGQNYFSGNKEWGLMISNADNNQISNNIVGGLNSLSIPIKNLVGGIKIKNSTGNIIGRASGEIYGIMKHVGNMIQGHDSAGVAIINSPGTQVIGNEVIKNQIGMIVKMDSLLINLLNKMHIMNNSVIQNIRAFEGTNTEVYIAGNQITENTGLATGIHLFNSTGKITGNLITGDAGDGIALENGSNPVITKNNIYGNIGFGVRNFDSSPMVDATQNWWGNASGPSANGPGSGDKVSTRVDFSEWKSSMIQFAAFAENDTIFVLSGTIDTVDVFIANFQANPGMVGVQFSDDLNWITGQTQSNLEFTNELSGAVLPLFVNVPPGVEPNSTNRIIISSVAQTGTGFSASDTFYISVYQPTLISLNISPDTVYISTGATWQFSAIGLDQENNSYTINAQWEASGGTIDNSGMFTAGTDLGTFYAKVTDIETQLTDSAVIVISQSTNAGITELQDFILYQNYPNPFSDRTTIKYNIPFESRVLVRIFTMNGTVVKQYAEAQPSGTHQIEWNVSEVPAGIYFYSIEVNEINGSHSFRDVKKMSLMRK